MTMDIRDARFYVVQQSADGEVGDAAPLPFEDAYMRAKALVDRGAHVRVLYTEEASQIEVTRFLSDGIPTSLLSGG